MRLHSVRSCPWFRPSGVRSSRPPLCARAAARLLRFAALAAALAAAPLFARADETLIPWGAAWRYWDHGTLPAPDWQAPHYDAANWKTGSAELGYGDRDEATTIGYGPDPANRYATSYYRHTFAVPNPATVKGLALRLLADDGAIVYLNGAEVVRTNMPAGPVTAQIYAASRLTGRNETIRRLFRLPPSHLVSGDNVLAVELHQARPDDGDASLDLELAWTTPSTILREPYVQSLSRTGAVIRWDAGADSVGLVRFGTDSNHLTGVARGGMATWRHEVRLGGLSPNTRYHYAVAADAPGAPLSAPRTFTTAPEPGTGATARVWVLGDSGYTTEGVLNVRNAFRTMDARRPADLILTLGDNAYPNGTEDQFQAAVFETFTEELARMPVWPSFGNHDGRSSSSATQTGPYFEAFALPTDGEAGGAPSGTEAYYSFDFGDIHFICLDSDDSSRDPNGPMLQWLRRDLAASASLWTIAYWHDAPYSHGSHNSDRETAMSEMRENALPILEAAGVDLVLTGHSHAYERSYLLDGHYGTSDTFVPSMARDLGLGRPEESGAYVKPTRGRAPHEGTVYLVCGSSSAVSAKELGHPAMPVAHRALGSVVLDVNGARMDAAFVGSDGQILDRFTLVKGAPWPPSWNVSDAAAALARAAGLAPTADADLARWNVATQGDSWDRLDAADALILAREAAR